MFFFNYDVDSISCYEGIIEIDATDFSTGKTATLEMDSD